MSYKQGDRITIVGFGDNDWYATGGRKKHFVGKQFTIDKYVSGKHNTHICYVSCDIPITAPNVNNQKEFFFIQAIFRTIFINPKVRIL